MHWVLQTHLFNEAAYQVLLETLERFEIAHSVHKIIPFIGELTEPEAPEVDGPVICMGSYSMRHASKKHGWYPGVFDLEPFNYVVQRQHWGKELLNYDSEVIMFKNAHFTGEAHLRPIEDSKAFAGRIFDDKEFFDWQIKVCVLEEDYGSSLTKDTLIQVSSVKTIFSEYRFWIVKNEIVCASLYKRGDKVQYSDVVDAELFDYVRRMIAVWSPLETFCIDVCYCEDGIKIVEIGTLNSCGFYAADIQKLVFALESGYNIEKSGPVWTS